MWRYQGKDLTNNDSNQEINEILVTLFWLIRRNLKMKLAKLWRSNNDVMSVSDLEIKNFYSIAISTFILPLTPPKSCEV